MASNHVTTPDEQAPTSAHPLVALGSAHQPRATGLPTLWSPALVAGARTTAAVPDVASGQKSCLAEIFRGRPGDDFPSNIFEIADKGVMVYLNKELIGGPGKVLVQLNSMEECTETIYKLCMGMVEDAEKKGYINKQTMLVEAASGHTGMCIGLCYAACQTGHRVALFLPDPTLSPARHELLRQLGAIVVITNARGGMLGAITAAELFTADRENAFMLRQFDNPLNPRIHYEISGPELFAATKGKIKFLVAGPLTGGFLTGAGKYLLEQDSSIQIVAVEPKESAVLSGDRPGPHGLQISTSDGIAFAHRMAREKGPLVGADSGAVALAAIDLAKQPGNHNKLVVAILNSHGEKHLLAMVAPSIIKEPKAGTFRRTQHSSTSRWARARALDSASTSLAQPQTTHDSESPPRHKASADSFLSEELGGDGLAVPNDPPAESVPPAAIPAAALPLDRQAAISLSGIAAMRRAMCHPNSSGSGPSCGTM